MASVVQFFLVLFVIFGCHLHSVDADYKQYVPFISDVHKHYGTSSVFFIFSIHNRRMQEYAMVHLLTRTFSDRGVTTLIIHFSKLNDRLSSYRKRMGRPLIVVLLKSLGDIVEFDKSINSTNESYPIWLVIFHGTSGKQFCNYCTNPVGNMFSLRFDTLMLVMCCEKPILQQWWSVRENRTEFLDFGTWNESEGFKLIGIKGLNAKRHDICGMGLRIVIVPNSALIHDHGNRLDGFLIQVLRELQIAMNFTITKIIREAGHGGYNSMTKSWSGAIGVLARGEADLALADFTITDFRLNVVDFTYPLLITQGQLFIKEPDGSGVHWTAYFQVFSLEIWLIIIMLIITTPLLLAVIEVRDRSASLRSLSIENYFGVWGIFCQQGLSEFPNETPARIAYFSIFASAIVVSAAYSAALISYLTLSTPTLPFSTLEGFTADKSYKLIVYQHSSQYDSVSTSTAPVFVEMMKLMKPQEELPHNSLEGWSQVCEERVALYTTIVDRVTAENLTCNVIGIDTGHVESLAMALPVGSQYTEVVNYHIERFKGNGMFKRLKSVYYHSENPIAAASHDVVEFSGVLPLLSILAGGIIWAFIVLTCERMYHSHKNRGRFLATGNDLGRIIVEKRLDIRNREKITLRKMPEAHRLQRRKFDTSFVGYYH